jgi:hypothetical protein
MYGILKAKSEMNNYKKGKKENNAETETKSEMIENPKNLVKLEAEKNQQNNRKSKIILKSKKEHKTESFGISDINIESDITPSTVGQIKKDKTKLETDENQLQKNKEFQHTLKDEFAFFREHLELIFSKFWLVGFWGGAHIFNGNTLRIYTFI